MTARQTLMDWLAALDGGACTQERIAREFDVSRQAVSKWLARYRAGFTVEAPRGPHGRISEGRLSRWLGIAAPVAPDGPADALLAALADPGLPPEETVVRVPRRVLVPPEALALARERGRREGVAANSILRRAVEAAWGEK